jgi:type IV pilus assembly protein PilA
MKPRSGQTGFTLIELMTVTAIIGLLSTVAIPQYLRASLRARRAERDTIVTSIARGTQSIVVRQGKFPTPFVGDWNPAGLPTTARRQMDVAAPVWKDLDLQIDGPVYHRFKFVGVETTVPPTLTVTAQGDLDGDGEYADRVVLYDRMDNALLLKTSDVSDDAVF